jgi:hypothetical protein
VSIPKLFQWEANRADEVLSRLQCAVDRLEAGDLETACEVARRLGLEDPPEVTAILSTLAAAADADPEIAELLTARFVTNEPVERYRLESRARLLVREMRGQWLDALDNAEPTARRLAQRRLRRLDIAVQARPQGRPPKRTAAERAVVVRYYREVFRWQQVAACLHERDRLRAERVQKVRDDYDIDGLAREIDMTTENLLAWYGLLPSGEPTGAQPLVAEEIAKLVIRARFRIQDDRRLANILARYRIR